MDSVDDLGFPLNSNSLLFLDSPEILSALTGCQENPSFLVLETKHNEFGGFAPVSAITNDVYPSSLIENTSTNQEKIPRTSSFPQEMVTQNQSLHHQNNYSKYFNTVENFSNVPSYTFRNGQRQSLYNENCFLTSTNNMMTTGLQSIGLQHGHVNQSYPQPMLSQTIPRFPNEPYGSTMMGSNVQQVQNTNGLANLNNLNGRQNHRTHPSLFHEKQRDHSMLLEQLKQIIENDKTEQPESSNMSIQRSAGALLSNPYHAPFASTPNTIPNPEYRTPMISNTHIPKTSQNYSPFMHTSYQSNPFAYDLQNSSSSKTTRPIRGRPRRNQTILPCPRPYNAQDKGKQPVTTMQSRNPTLYNQYQNPYTNTMIQQSGVVRQRSCYDQLENELPSSKIMRIMPPLQEKSVADLSIVPFQQDGNLHPTLNNHHEERLAKNTVYDPLYASLGLPIDPHLRFF